MGARLARGCAFEEVRVLAVGAAVFCGVVLCAVICTWNYFQGGLHALWRMGEAVFQVALRWAGGHAFEALQKDGCRWLWNRVSIHLTSCDEVMTYPVSSSQPPQELRRSPHASVRNNLVVVLSDLCVRYTALIDG